MSEFKTLSERKEIWNRWRGPAAAAKQLGSVFKSLSDPALGVLSVLGPEDWEGEGKQWERLLESPV